LTASPPGQIITVMTNRIHIRLRGLSRHDWGLLLASP
jgi:hypothetical protein